MPKTDKSKMVRCCVCFCLVPEGECVELYADLVCKPCENEIAEDQADKYEAETQREIDRVWGYEQ